MSEKRYVPGITFTSLIAMGFALLCAGILLQWDAVVVNTGSFHAEHSVPLPAIVVLILLTAIGALLWRMGKIRLLTRAELLCVLFVMLIALPLMTQGFWHRYLSMANTLIEEPNLFQQLRSYPDKLWPHGENLLADALTEANKAELEISGNVTWEPLDLEPGRTVMMPVLRNERPEQVSSIRIRVPAVVDGKRLITAGEPFMVSVLARPGEAPSFALDSKSQYYGRVHGGRGGKFAEAFATGVSGKRTFSQKEGFLHVGGGNVSIPTGADEAVVVEFALDGVGQLALAEPVMMSNDALISAVRGKRLVTQSEFDQLPLDERGGLVVRPDSMWSAAGIKFLLSGYIPLEQWLRPVLWWTAFVLLLFLASLAINVLLRKQWMENERFQLPLVKIPMALMGHGPDDIDAGIIETGPMPLIWRNRMMWFGLIAGALWTLARAWHFYNPKVPDLSIYIHLKPYFNDPGYGLMWNNVYFMVSALFVSIAMFLELNTLKSIVVGFFGFRAMLWVTYAWGIDMQLPGFPWPQSSQTGAYVGYALVILIFTRKYLWSVLKAAVTNDKKASAGEPFSYRTAILLLVATFVMTFAWAKSIGLDVAGIIVLYSFLVIVALVTSRLRTECGAPFSYLGPIMCSLVLTSFGGAFVFGSGAVLFSYVLSFIVGATPFFLFPGAQMELIELGRRFKVRPKHLAATCILGLMGGIVVGGWIFLSQSYGLGGRNLNYNWAYEKKSWQFTSYLIDQTNATSAYLKSENEGGVDDDGRSLTPNQMGFAFGATLTAAVALLRQVFPAFWFHPIGILLGFNTIAEMIWGSCLVAWALRLVVLHFGGAATVRKRLQPLFVGVFCGTLGAHMILMAHSAWLQANGVEHTMRWWPFLVP